MPLTLPNLNLVASGQPIDGDLLNALFVAIAAKFNAGVVGADISPSAGIPGSAISPNTLPGDRLVAGSVGNSAMGLLAIGNANIIDTTIQKGKLSTTVGQRIAKPQIDIAVATFAMSFNPGGAFTVFEISAALRTATVAGVNSYAIRGTGMYRPTTGGDMSGLVVNYDPVAAIPTATVTPLAIYVDSVVINAGGASTANANLVYINTT